MRQNKDFSFFRFYAQRKQEDKFSLKDFMPYDESQHMN